MNGQSKQEVTANYRTHLLGVMAELNHDPMCGSDNGEDMDECDCWKSVMTHEIDTALTQRGEGGGK